MGAKVILKWVSLVKERVFTNPTVHSWWYSTTRLEAGGTWTTITISMLPYTTNAYHRISPLHYNLVPLPINTIFSTTQLITPLSTIIICYLFSHLLFPDWTAIITICPRIYTTNPLFNQGNGLPRATAQLFFVGSQALVVVLLKGVCRTSPRWKIWKD